MSTLYDIQSEEANINWHPVSGALLYGTHSIDVKNVDYQLTLEAKELDLHHGVDKVFIHKMANPFTAGLRIQDKSDKWGYKNWESFTVRLSVVGGGLTEWDKRKKDVLAYLAGDTKERRYPQWMIHCYMLGPGEIGQKFAWGAVKTEDLIKFMVAHEHDRKLIPIRKNEQDGNLFYAVFWEHLKAAGIKVCTTDEVEYYLGH